MTDHPPDQGGPGGNGSSPPPAVAPRRRRTALVVGAAALIAVVGIAVGLVALFSAGNGEPAAVVRTYLQALSRGDASTALAQGTQPPDTTFLTGDTLRAQQAIARIGAIHVGDGSTSGTRARVPATYTFGGRRADESFSLTEIGGVWKLDDTVYPISLSGLRGVPGLTLLGAPTSGRDTVYVFPGPLVWGTSNAYLTVKESNSDGFALAPGDGSFSLPPLTTELSSTGRTAATRAVQTYVGTCARSRELSPAGCPQTEDDYNGVDGTATWTAPTDLSSLEYRVSTPVTEVYVSGELSWKVTYVAESFDGTRSNVTREVGGPLYGRVDLTRSPPVYSE